MSYGQKAVFEDEEDWEDFKKLAKLTDVTWDVYSTEANIAREVYRELRCKGRMLKLRVRQVKEIRELRKKHEYEIRTLTELIKIEINLYYGNTTLKKCRRRKARFSNTRARNFSARTNY